MGKEKNEKLTAWQAPRVTKTDKEGFSGGEDAFEEGTEPRTIKLSKAKTGTQAGIEKGDDPISEGGKADGVLFKRSSGKETASAKNKGLVKTTIADNYRKTAKLLILIGKEEAAKILARLDTDQVERLSREIAGIRHIDDTEAEAILSEFHARAAELDVSGGVETARRLLRSAFGEEKGEAFLKKAVPQAAGRPFDFLEDIEGDQIALLLRDEALITAALVISRLSAAKAAAAIAAWDSAKRPEILKRIAKLETVSPEIIDRVAAALRDKARALGRTDGLERIDGKAALAAILKNSGMADSERLLEELSLDDPDLGLELKERLYSPDDIVKIDDRALERHLRSMTDKDIALLLKGVKNDPADKILANLSSARGKAVLEERELLGAVPRRDVDSVLGDFMAWFRQGRESGKIMFIDEEMLE